MKNIQNIKRISYIAMLGVILVFITSCRKEKDQSTICTEDNNIADGLFSDVFQLTSNETEAAEEGAGLGKMEGLATSDSCATITYSLSADSSYIDTLIVDYGNNTTCETNGRIRRGIVNIYMDGKFRQAGTVTTVVPQDFYIDDHQVEGQKVITNLGLVGGFNWQYSVDVTDAVITDPDGSTFQWESHRTNVWRIFEGEIAVTGTASGLNRNDLAFELAITEELLVKVGCRWITQGKFELTPDGFDTRMVDYGDGTCDNDATVTIGSNVYNINMP